ncbi:MAG: amidohydrolase [Angelakisella sp.]|nr:amidohydrolase [Angelakisella sp.]
MEEVLYYNANIITMEEDAPHAQAVLVRDGKIAAVGGSEKLLANCSSSAQKIDMGGRTMLPGFIDSHSHITMTCLFPRFPSPPVGDIDSPQKLAEAVKTYLAEHPVKRGKWFVGMGYDNASFPNSIHPTCHDLDKASKTIPIVMIHTSGHVCVLNSAALRQLGITADTPAPEGGTIHKDAVTGEPTGLLEEKAMMKLLAKKAMKMAPSIGDILNMPVKAQELYASYGITTAQEGAAYSVMNYLYRWLGNRHKMKLDVAAYMMIDGSAKALKGVDSRVVKYRNHYRIAGAKLLLDGSPQAKTAWLSKPYYQVPKDKSQDYNGYPVYENHTQVKDYFVQCLQNHWQILVHCNGDAACQQFIDCYRAAINETGIHENLRPVMVHAQTVRDDQLDAMKELGISPTFFNDHVYYWGDYHLSSVLGPERGSRISPFKTAVEKGINVTIHQDTPVVPPNMLFSVHNAVNRITRDGQPIGTEFAPSTWEALKAITCNAAWQYHEENLKGTIKAGKLADFAVLNGDPLTVSPSEIKNITVLETIKEGQTIFKKEE